MPLDRGHRRSCACGRYKLGLASRWSFQCLVIQRAYRYCQLTGHLFRFIDHVHDNAVEYTDELELNRARNVRGKDQSILVPKRYEFGLLGLSFLLARR